MTERIVIERLDYEGILEQTVLIYLGDGIYAEPQEFSGNQGESSNTNNHVCGGSQKNSERSEDGNDNTGTVYEI